MKTFLLTCLIGMIAGAIDILPMIKMKLDRHSIASASYFISFFPLSSWILTCSAWSGG